MENKPNVNTAHWYGSVVATELVERWYRTCSGETSYLVVEAHLTAASCMLDDLPSVDSWPVGGACK